MELNLKNNLFKFIWGIFLILPFSGFGQNWVADSICIGFGGKSLPYGSFRVLEALDHRNEFPEYIGVFEQKKALFFPVDQIVKTQNPLSLNFETSFDSDSIDSKGIKVDIERFYINQSSSLDKRTLTLFSTLELSQIKKSDTTFLGTLYYEFPYSQKKKLPVSEGYETTIDLWSRTFTSDVLAIGQNLDLLLGDNLYHFRRGDSAISKNLYIETEVFAGLNFWGIDGELWFSEPEGKRIFNRNVGIMRYVNRPNVQAIAVGKNVRMWNYRFTPRWLFTHKMAFLVGINNWKDMSTAAHKLEEILYFDLSFTQRINYNKLDEKGLVFGLGIMEDFSYVVYHKAQFNLGVSLNFAYKF